MHQLGKIIGGIPSSYLRNRIVRFLYKRKGLRLESIEKTADDNFWIHKVNGIYFATEVLNWYRNYESFENDCRQISLAYFKPVAGNIIIDLGAGLGEEAIVYSKLVGSGGRVYAVEANPRICKVLKNVIDLNNFSNTTVLNLAISDQSGTIEIEDAEDSYISSSVNTNKSTKTFTVEAMGMDDFIEKNNIARIDLLKANIEGAEKFVMQTLVKHFGRVKHFAISCHDFRYKRGESEFYKTKELIISYFNSKGMTVDQQNSGIDHIDDWIYVKA